jgi:hypothetical protein
MVNPIGLSITGSGTGSTRLSFGTLEENKPIIVIDNNIISTNILSIDSFITNSLTTKEITIDNVPNDAILTIKGGSVGNSIINFGDEIDYNKGRLTYFNTAKQFQLAVDNTYILTLNTTTFYPNTTGNIYLGSSSNCFKALFCQDYIYVCESGATPLPPIAYDINDKLRITGIDQSNISLVSSTTQSIMFGDSSAKSSGRIKYNHTNDEFLFTANGIETAILDDDKFGPTLSTNNIDFGTALTRWRHLYMFGTLDIESNSAANIKIKADTYISNCYIKFGTKTNDSVGQIKLDNSVPAFNFFIATSPDTLGTNELTLTSSSLYPTTTAGLTLGTSSFRWGDLYINNVLDIESSSGSAYIEIKSKDIGDDSYIKFGIAANDNLGQIRFDTTNNLFNFSITTVGTDEKLSLTTTSLYPYTIAGLTLGTSEFRWGTLYNSGIIDCKSSTGVSYIRLQSKDMDYNSTIYFGTNLTYNKGSISVNTLLNDMTISSDNDIILKANSKYITFDGDVLYSTITNLIDLGNSTHYWNYLYSTNINAKEIIITPLTAGSSTNIYLKPASSTINAKIHMGANDLCEISYYESSKTISILSDSLLEYGIIINQTNLYPKPANTLNLGSSSNKWNTIYAVTGTIDTSDERNKKDIVPIDNKILDAWGDISIIFYKWINSVEEKGYNARIHSGLISQRIKEAFANHGLDAHQYGLFCYDEWPEKIEESVKKLEDGTEKIIEKIIPAGNCYGIRSTECLFVEAAYQRRRADRIEEKLTAFETKLTNIEAKLNS